MVVTFGCSHAFEGNRVFTASHSEKGALHLFMLESQLSCAGTMVTQEPKRIRMKGFCGHLKPDLASLTAGKAFDNKQDSVVR